jgi:ubiquinone/menaquinone biosynthesis C-methylase UbiE
MTTVNDKSLFHYGNIYHAVIDPLLKASWKQIADLVPENSRVFDAGCGTGRLSLLLRRQRNCQVVGADLSPRMLDFAEKSNPYDDVEFKHMDMTNIEEYEDNSFDYSVMCQVIHELPTDKQPKAVSELMRIGKKAVILDSNTPLPRNLVGIVVRLMDATFGRDHYDNFKSYIASEGIMDILDRAGLTSHIVRRLVFRSGFQHVVILAR